MLEKIKMIFKNFILWIPYMIAALFMHSLFSSFFLIFWVLALISGEDDSQEHKCISKFRMMDTPFE